MWQRRAVQEELTVPHFGKIGRPSNVLKLYQKRRALLSPRDAAAAFYALGRLNRNSAAKINRDPLANHPAAIELYADLVASAPYLPSREVANALLGAAYMRCSSEPVLTALCAAAAEKALAHFSQRDVASVVYSLGQLGRHDDELMPKLLSRVVSDASSFHAIEMMLSAHGLADLQLAPPSALMALSRAAVPKIEQFGAQELPRLLSSFASLGFHDEPLVRLAASQLPQLLTDMDPKGIRRDARCARDGAHLDPECAAGPRRRGCAQGGELRRRARGCHPCRAGALAMGPSGRGDHAERAAAHVRSDGAARRARYSARSHWG